MSKEPIFITDVEYKDGRFHVWLVDTDLEQGDIVSFRLNEVEFLNPLLKNNNVLTAKIGEMADWGDDNYILEILEK